MTPTDTSRLFRPQEDTARLHDLIADIWRIQGHLSAFHIGDLHWRLRPQPSRDPPEEIRLWEDANGRVMGFTWFTPPDSADVICHPEAERRELEPRMLARLEDQCRAHESPKLVVGAFDQDQERVQLLRERTYRRGKRGLIHMLRDLEEPLADSQPAAGYTIRVTREADLAGQAEAVGRAFGNQPKPLDTYQALRAGPHYRNGLDVVAVSEQGEVAAFCIAWLDMRNQAGLFEPVGCHPDHRRRGLAQAVILAALARLRERGAAVATVCTWSSSAPALALYESCGFRAVSEDWDWIRQIEPHRRAE